MWNVCYTVELWFNEVGVEEWNCFVEWSVCYIENFNVMNLKGNEWKICYIEFIVNDWFYNTGDFCGNTIL